LLALGPKAHHVIPSVVLTKKRHIRKTHPNSCHSERSEESAQPTNLPEDLIPHCVQIGTPLAIVLPIPAVSF